MNVQHFYEAVVSLRDSAQTAQTLVARCYELPDDPPAANPSEAWWHAQGHAEALATVMTMLEAHGAFHGRQEHTA